MYLYIYICLMCSIDEKGTKSTFIFTECHYNCFDSRPLQHHIRAPHFGRQIESHAVLSGLMLGNTVQAAWLPGI